MPVTDQDPDIIRSPLSRSFTSGGITVDVQIYRLETSEGWTLELVDRSGNSTVWDELFLTDGEAFDEFLLGVQELGLAGLLEPDEEDPPLNTIP